MCCLTNRFFLLLCLLFLTLNVAISQTTERLIRPGTDVTLPIVSANDNTITAGKLTGNVLSVELEVSWAAFRMETEDRPGLRVRAIGEKGKAPQIPGPLLRVEAGTVIKAKIHNKLPDSSITVFGLHTRPSELSDSLLIEPGQSKLIEFGAGEPGTYLYWIRVGMGISSDMGEMDQLAGALVIDPKGGSPEDRIMVINIFSERADTLKYDVPWFESLTINGLSWPYTERIRPSVGDTLRWRVINASNRNHPMHLHGFYYDITSRGDWLKDRHYNDNEIRTVVTEFMRRRETMMMEWVPKRPGNWLFHCHLSFHVSPEIRLPGAGELDEDHVHMAGLVLGIEVSPGPTDLISRGEPRELKLYANEYKTDSLSRFGFSLDPYYKPDSVKLTAPGPLLIMKQYQSTNVTVSNRMSIPTGVHWHGLELDSWADGVPNWSASDGKVSPIIAPGKEFTYKLSHMRSGTFIYHSHLDDIHQLTGGLYGGLVVLPEGKTYDPDTDHVYIVQWRTPNPQAFSDVELNGRVQQPDIQIKAGELHRIRVINIAPAGNISVRMLKGEESYPIMALAKDGADLPESQQVQIEESPRFGVGETADFLFTATEPGNYELVVGYSPKFSWRQKWIVGVNENLTKE